MAVICTWIWLFLNDKYNKFDDYKKKKKTDENYSKLQQICQTYELMYLIEYT